MKKSIFTLLSAAMILALAFSFLAAAPGASTLAQANDGPKRQLREVPQEIQQAFKDGMTIEDFLARIDGPAPKALADYASERVALIVELAGDPLAQVYASAQAARLPMTPASQQAHVASLQAAQAPVRAAIEAMGDSAVISQYTKAYNGLLVSVPLSRVSDIQRLPGVVAVHKAPLHTPALENSVPLINADDVWAEGYDGTGVSIAVIDTGIDYYHSALGGSGDPMDYADDDPTIIEPGSFPTAKVVGGYDFAGTDYDASSDDPAAYIPNPDPDPLDENDHGTHVASIAAGIGNATIGEGVAPGASLYALKVFGADGSTNLTVDAIEWSLDPNGDGDLSDHVDVINMSLGSDFGPNDPSEPDIVASNLASSIGVVVVSSAGNAGDTHYVTGSPAAADSVISVAASTTGFVTGPLVEVPTQSFETVYQVPGFDGGTGLFTMTTSAPLVYAGTLITDTLCTTGALAPDAMAGDIALIQRGDCAFSIKVNNAALLGAVGALIYNHSDGGDSLVSMVGDPVAIPAGFIGHTYGTTLSAYGGETVHVAAYDNLSTIVDNSTPADTAATFTSRGPRGFDSFLKPDVTAPGVSIEAAQRGGGDAGLVLGGTSMASPHVAGVAAQLKEAYPAWSSGQIKAAMMNTAVDLADPASAQVPLQGAGRVDALEAFNTEGLLFADNDLVSLNWGLITFSSDSYLDSQQLTLQNLSTTAKTYEVEWEFGPGSYTSGFSLTMPMTVTVPASPGFAYIPVGLELDGTAMMSDFGGVLEEYNGYITLTNDDVVTDTLRLPFYAVVQPYPELNVSGSVTGLNAGEIEISHSGAISSSLWAYPLLATDPNEPGQGDEGDVRAFGMDYGFFSATYGDIFVPAINTYGSWHTPQPYFAEFDLYIDADGDGFSDTVNFNYNLGWWNGGDDTNDWVVIQVDYNLGMVFLGSPYLIYSDFNTGFMEWYLPGAYNYLGGSDTEMDYVLYGFDYEGNSDLAASGQFDYLKPPFMWSLSGDPGPADPMATGEFSVYDPDGYALSQPEGLMVVDYLGKGGAEQVYPFEFTLDQPYMIQMPTILKPPAAP